MRTTAEKKKAGRSAILVIVGPTASGKSDLAVSLAKKYGGEIVSADSRQVYRGLDIGTGKVTRREMRGVRHHLLDVADPESRFSAEKYRRLARAAIADILSRGKLPILCGGTGFYIDAVLNDGAVSDVPPDEKLRARLAKKSPAQLLLMLKKLDLKRWRTIADNPSDSKNARRIIRAIEVAGAGRKNRMEERRPKVSSGTAFTVSQGHGTSNLRPQYTPFFLGIKVTPESLKKRISARLERRLTGGMIAEARRLHRNGLSWKRMDELGLEYRFLALYLQGKLSKKMLVERLSTEIWQYARRQMTWFRRNKKIRWIEPARGIPYLSFLKR